MACMDNRYVQAAPFVDSNAVTDSLSCYSKHSRVVTDEDDSSSCRYSSLNDADNVRDGETSEQWPHAEVLKACG